MTRFTSSRPDGVFQTHDVMGHTHLVGGPGAGGSLGLTESAPRRRQSMPFVPFETGIEISGQSVRAIVDGFHTFAVLGSSYLLEWGLGKPTALGRAEVDPKAWYSQEDWLRCLRDIGTQLGERLVMQVGLTVPRNAMFPEGIRDIREAIRSIDVSYHLNHRKNGVPMFEPSTGRMQEGIGHYGCELVPHQRKIISQCETPYSCAFDRGLLTAMAQLCEANARVAHDHSDACRKRGSRYCSYVITW